MTLREAWTWLEEHGGRWFVHATASACLVVAIVGSLRIDIPVRQLTAQQVDSALVDAVQELKSKLA